MIKSVFSDLLRDSAHSLSAGEKTAALEKAAKLLPVDSQHLDMVKHLTTMEKLDDKVIDSLVVIFEKFGRPVVDSKKVRELSFEDKDCPVRLSLPNKKGEMKEHEGILRTVHMDSDGIVIRVMSENNKVVFKKTVDPDLPVDILG